MKNLSLIGSTGSIGTQTLDVVRRHPDRFRVLTLTAGRNADLLIRQAQEFHPEAVVIADVTRYAEVREALAGTNTEVLAGKDALCEAAVWPGADTVVTALVGFAGLASTVAAIEAGRTIALANKETLVVAGSLIMPLAKKCGVDIVPIDSEHSAIFQCLQGEPQGSVEKILLTASGGPFRTLPREALAAVTAAQALRHPNWTMGEKITIDSATMMNKGFEMIEACHLFGVTPAQVEVVVHPESVIHSAVQFVDGSVKAQLAVPDMRLPIQHALCHPERAALDAGRINLFRLGALHFEEPDTERFPCLAYAYRAAEQGGLVPCAMNAANEVANLAFRQGMISYPRLCDIILHTMERTPVVAAPTLDDCFAADKQGRAIAEEYL
ncbi:MAG: 1-deoxy-D-xylulose-5-phosphate reductoisomerase [Bacteroidaceae bacterium]|nr:1-deoxy-D-xylulose-5-phosphate reductoisomerase [Bacteroidaceae bacterium]